MNINVNRSVWSPYKVVFLKVLGLGNVSCIFPKARSLHCVCQDEGGVLEVNSLWSDHTEQCERQSQLSSSSSLIRSLLSCATQVSLSRRKSSRMASSSVSSSRTFSRCQALRFLICRKGKGFSSPKAIAVSFLQDYTMVEKIIGICWAFQSLLNFIHTNFYHMSHISALFHT